MASSDDRLEHIQCLECGATIPVVFGRHGPMFRSVEDQLLCPPFRDIYDSGNAVPEIATMLCAGLKRTLAARQA